MHSRKIASRCFSRVFFSAVHGLKTRVLCLVLALLSLVCLPSQLMASAVFVTAKFEAPAPRDFGLLCKKYDWLCATSGRDAVLDDADLREIESVNLRVNRSTPEISDLAQYGVEDVWALPTSRGGDCEDIAMLKKKELVARGIPPETLSIATVLMRDGENHAVLLARAVSGDYVLDNLTDKILLWSRTDYTYLTVQDNRKPEKWDAVFEGGMLPSVPAKIRAH